jgi:hypothetical protein
VGHLKGLKIDISETLLANLNEREGENFGGKKSRRKDIK